MMLKLSGIEERISSKIDLVVPLHVAQWILNDLLSGLQTRTLTYPKDRFKSPDLQLREARDIINDVLNDLMDGKVGVS